MRVYGFQRGAAKDLIMAICFFSLLQILNILYPMILKNLVTQEINNDTGTLPEMGHFLINAGIVLALLVVIFLVSQYAYNRVSVYGIHCRSNARAMMYEKMMRVPTNVLNEYGTSKFLSCMTEDTYWVKYRFRKLRDDYDFIASLCFIYSWCNLSGNRSFGGSPCIN